MHHPRDPSYKLSFVDIDLQGMPVLPNSNACGLDPRDTKGYYVKIYAILAAFALPWLYWIYSLCLYEKSWWPNYYQSFAENIISDHPVLYVVLLWLATGAAMVIAYDLYSHAKDIEQGLGNSYQPIRSSVGRFFCAWIYVVILFSSPFFLVVSAATLEIAQNIYDRPECSGDTPVTVFLYRGGAGEAPRAEVLDPYFPGARASVVFSLNWDSSSNATDATTLSLSRGGGSAEPLNILYDLAAGTATLPELNLAATFDPSNIGLLRIPDLDMSVETYEWKQGSMSGASVRAVNGMGSTRLVLAIKKYSPGDRSVLSACVAREEGQTAATVLVPLGLAMSYHAIDTMS
ncbi:hypothetical protein EXIGLDRAFT_781765 [Exidia glandulosa HHB12029]|uniref:Uncharacterized protein n=1 Tax=Exidia glandulosa HHB12029 TaxID=1314781 RepID=A0A165B565_EXIGL|nr:hypothetical protein EXIGLDRAFT_781765 [Exidia glandulosa HHB12029]